MPTLQQQLRIAEFLDRETTKIDTLIEDQRRMIDLVSEELVANRHYLVTRGVDPAPKTRESGLGWCPRIPVRWQVRRLVTLARMDSGHTPDSSKPEYWDGDVPWVSLNDTSYLKAHDYIAVTAKSLTDHGLANSAAHLLPAGTVVFSRDATIGRCGILAKPMAVSQHFIAWICGPEVMPEYLLLALRSMSQELERLTMGATIATIGMPDVRKLAIPLPPVNEQELIVRQFSRERTRLRAASDRAARLVRLLREYRAALITAAVTGQIDRVEAPGFDSQPPA